MHIVLQAAYVLYKDFQILFLSRLVSFPNVYIFIFSLVFIELPVKISKFKYFSFLTMTRL
jgi:hypothetical protein